MVYRGKPSAGCDLCRRSKKRCTLETPSCARCLKLNKPCSGYRDLKALRFHDETQRVTLKAERRKLQSTATSTPAETAFEAPIPAFFAVDPEPADSNGIVEVSREPSHQSTFWTGLHMNQGPEFADFISTNLTSTSSWTTPAWEPELTPDATTGIESSPGYLPNSATSLDLFFPPIPRTLLPQPSDIATHYFLSTFTSSAHWSYVSAYASQPSLDPCLTLAIKACGMAALANVSLVPHGREWSRKVYVSALRMLNDALGDGGRCGRDESLIAVTLLSLYENLVCDSPQSIQSWKAHIQGATQLLRLRGKAQFKSLVGRNLFRETRAQIMIHCIWDDLLPPSFLQTWTSALQSLTDNLAFVRPTDDLTTLCFDLATLQHALKHSTITPSCASTTLSELETRLDAWASSTPTSDPRWAYTTVVVPDAPHIWDGKLHAYTGQPVPGVWNTYRTVRIIVTRISDLLNRRLSSTQAAGEIQTSPSRVLRRNLADEICASIPCQLGQTSPPVFSSQNVLVSAYNSIWPLFFAGRCVLERINASFPSHSTSTFDRDNASSAAAVQLQWILGRLRYISDSVGLRWAGGVADTLGGDFGVLEDFRPEFEGSGDGLRPFGGGGETFGAGEGGRDDWLIVEKGRGEVVVG